MKAPAPDLILACGNTAKLPTLSLTMTARYRRGHAGQDRNAVAQGRPTGRARGAGVRRVVGRPRSTPVTCGERSTASRCTRSTASTCWSAPITCRSSRGSGPTTASLLDRAAWGRSASGRCSNTGRTRPRCCRSTLQPLLRWRMARGRARRRSAGAACAPSPRERRDCSRRGARPRSRTRGSDGRVRLREGRKGQGGWWGWSDGQARARMAVLGGPSHHRDAARQLRAGLRPARAGAAAPRSWRADAARGRGRSARCSRIARARSASPPRPICATISGSTRQSRRARDRRAGRGRRADPGHGRGLERAGLSPSRRRAARAESTAAALLAPFDPLVWEREPDRAAVRLPLPDRDLHAGATSACTAITSCRSCSATRLVARVDLKADRARSRLLVRKVTWESKPPPDAADRLNSELRLMADWLALEAIDQ